LYLCNFTEAYLTGKQLWDSSFFTALNAIVACATLTECAEMASVLTNSAGDEFTTSAVAIDFGPGPPLRPLWSDK
jgi:hypothetical protein